MQDAAGEYAHAHEKVEPPERPTATWNIQAKSAVCDSAATFRANYLFEIEASLNLSERRKLLTREACNKCEVVFEAGNCSSHTQFLTSFLFIFHSISPVTVYDLFKIPSVPSPEQASARGSTKSNKSIAKKKKRNTPAPSLSTQRHSSDKTPEHWST